MPEVLETLDYPSNFLGHPRVSKKISLKNMWKNEHFLFKRHFSKMHRDQKVLVNCALFFPSWTVARRYNSICYGKQINVLNVVIKLNHKVNQVWFVVLTPKIFDQTYFQDLTKFS